MKENIKLIAAFSGAVLSRFLGGFDGMVYTLLAFVIFDYITGVSIAITEKKLSSAVGFKGIFRKVLIFAMVGVGNMIDLYILKGGTVIRSAVIFFYIANEGISLTENAAKLGLPIPEKLKSVFEQIK